MIREFRQSGECFGVRVRTNEVRTGVRVATVGDYDRNQHCFKINFTSSEGITGGCQQLRFDSRQLAQQYCDSLQGDCYVSPARINHRIETCRAIPIRLDGREIVAYCPIIKWADGRDNSLRKFRADRPEFFTDEEVVSDSNTVNGVALNAIYAEIERLAREFNINEYSYTYVHRNPEYVAMNDELRSMTRLDQPQQHQRYLDLRNRLNQLGQQLEDEYYNRVAQLVTKLGLHINTRHMFKYNCDELLKAKPNSLRAVTDRWPHNPAYPNIITAVSRHMNQIYYEQNWNSETAQQNIQQNNTHEQPAKGLFDDLFAKYD